MRKALSLLLVAATAAGFAPGAASAETRSDVVNGATCIPYPPFDTSNAVPFSFFLYGFGQSAYCHFTMPDGWSARDLSYVLFVGTVGSGSQPMRVRLCIYRSSGLATTCGSERTITPGGFPVNWVSPPSSLPSSAQGAYLSVRFPDGVVSTLQNIVPVWSR